MTTSIRVNILRRGLPLAFAIMAVGVAGGYAQASEPDQIRIDSSTTQTVGRDFPADVPIQEVTTKVAVEYDPVTLTTNSGVALLNDSVADAARKACDTSAIDAFSSDSDSETCVREAIESAKSQVASAIARARSAAAAHQG
jgi:UrcA family protein